MPSFKKLALIATETETADTVTDPKTIPPAVFQKRAGGKKLALIATEIYSKMSVEMEEMVELATEPITIPPTVFPQ